MKLNYFSLFFIVIIINHHIELKEIPFRVIQNERELTLTNRRIRSVKEEEEERQCELKKINEMYVIEVAIGNPRQKVLLKVSSLFKGIAVVYSMKTVHGFNRFDSKTFKLIEYSHSNRLGKGAIAIDELEIASLNVTIDSVPFFLVFDPAFIHVDYAGLFGLAYYEEDYSDANLRCSFDFFDYLDKNRRILNIIGFKSLSNTKGMMSYGELPLEVKQNKKLYRTCPITTIIGSHLWKCLLNAVYLDDGSFFRVNASVDFLIGGNTIEVSKEFFSFIYTKYFSQEAACSVTNQQFREIICNKDYDTKKIGIISLIFGKWTLKIKGHQLFSKHNGSLKFAIISEQYTSNWVISPSMISNLYLFLDWNNHQIGFYGN